eukprot:CAMPEP_0114697932 /NCGR_PEP_ID=MMETSP0191-20121206/74321_1 /TAXON_ID=126664 /ORGANISM="Sorites sp." /LENGTH=245 /DNA_ID=CAMNT_0001997607 /DNA_START=492 /DNA_END=1226 /DNA_ORIENTATION=+
MTNNNYIQEHIMRNNDNNNNNSINNNNSNNNSNNNNSNNNDNNGNNYFNRRDVMTVELDNDTDDPESSEKKDDGDDDLGSDDETNNNNDPQNETDLEILREQQKLQERRKYIKRFKASIEDEKKFRGLMLQKGYKIVDMGDDGNCLFRSISHQIYGTQDFHSLLRKKCVEYLISEKDYFGNYVTGGFNEFDLYCNHMKRDAVWGDNLEIQVFSEIYGRSIEIYAYDNKPMKTFSNENNNNNNNNN